MFQIGQRVQFKRDVDRYPDFEVKQGATGTVTFDAMNLGVKLDTGVNGSKVWDDIVWWNDFHNPPEEDLEVIR